jgi:hypothetical protein
MNAPRTVRFDWARFRDRVDRLRAEHDARTTAEAEAVTLDAFRRWGEPPPASFNTGVAPAAGHPDATTPHHRDEP